MNNKLEITAKLQVPLTNANLVGLEVSVWLNQQGQHDVRFHWMDVWFLAINLPGEPKRYYRHDICTTMPVLIDQNFTLTDTRKHPIVLDRLVKNNGIYNREVHARIYDGSHKIIYENTVKL